MTCPTVLDNYKLFTIMAFTPSRRQHRVHFVILKGLAIIFLLVRKPHLSSSEGRKYTYISKQIKNPHKFAAIMKKNRVFLVIFILEGTLTVFFSFPKILVLLCVVHSKEMKMISEN